jgi:NitT/TauT family transport system substrate-binding protein
MLTDFLLYGWHAPLFAGKAEGFYSYDGVDVTLEAGKGSADGATKVSTGAAQFAQLDAVSALTAISKGEGLKLIGIYFAKYPGGMCYVSGRHQINSYKDLEGLKIGAAAGDAYMVALPGLMRNAGADPTKYQLITMTAANTTPALISGQIDATPCGLPTFPDRQIAAGKQGLTLKHFLFADHGFGADGFALVTTGKLISSDPSLVQHVVDAWATSAAWSFANPSKAVADFISANPSLNPDSATQSFSGVLPYLKGPNGYFVFNQPSLQATVDFVNQAYSASLQTSAVFDDEFVNKLPAAFKLGKLP